MQRNARKLWLFLTCISLLAGITTTASAQTLTGSIEPRAGTWKPWVLKSGSELRLPPPPDAQATTSESEELRALAGRRDAAALERIRYWDFWSPAHRWNEMLSDTAVAQNFGIGGGNGIRAFAMLNVAIHDALIAAWDSKYAHNRRRPAEADPKLVSALPEPRSPSYPCEYSVAAGAGSAVLAHLFPGEAKRFALSCRRGGAKPRDSRRRLSERYTRRTRTGPDRRAPCHRVSQARRRRNGKGEVPVGPGLWTGSNPGGVDDVKLEAFRAFLGEPVSAWSAACARIRRARRRGCRSEELQAHADHERQSLLLAVRTVRRAGPDSPAERRGRPATGRVRASTETRRERRAPTRWCMSPTTMAGSPRRTRSSTIGRRDPISSTRPSPRSSRTPTSQATSRTRRPSAWLLRLCSVISSRARPRVTKVGRRSSGNRGSGRGSTSAAISNPGLRLVAMWARR